MTKVAKSGLVLAGIALGCAASSASPTVVSWAQQAGPGAWSCYDVFAKDIGEGARSWEAPQVTANMNKVAMHAAPGTVLALPPKLVCVKH